MTIKLSSGKELPVTGHIVTDFDAKLGSLAISEHLDINLPADYRSRLEIQKTGSAGTVSTNQERQIEKNIHDMDAGNLVVVSVGEGDVINVKLSVVTQGDLVFELAESFSIHSQQLVKN